MSTPENTLPSAVAEALKPLAFTEAELSIVADMVAGFYHAADTAKTLAPPLEWEWYKEDTSANAPNGLYTAEANPPHGEPGLPFYRAEFLDETDLTVPFEQRVSYAPHAFPHIEQAKAACEHHYATGEWE